MQSFSKTRLAPTPSGYLHAGNLFSFALTAGYARDAGAGLLLRIDDMDQARARPAYLQYIFDALKKLELHYDEGPHSITEFENQWSQRLRLPLYEQYLNRLVNTGLVFACTCSRKEIEAHSATGAYPGTCRHKALPLDTPGAAWRIKTDLTEISIRNLKGGTSYPFPPAMKDFIVRKKDGMPAYQLSSLADDLHFGVDLIVRGMDLLNSTLAQTYLALLLKEDAFLNACFVHHRLITNKQGEKISKSAGLHTDPPFDLQKPASVLWEEIGQQTLGRGGLHSWQHVYTAFLQD